MTTADIGVDLSKYDLGWSDAEDYIYCLLYTSPSPRD